MLKECKAKKIKQLQGGFKMKLKNEAVKQIKEICARYKDEPSPLMLVLTDVQKEYGYLPLEVQEVISEELNIPVADIYGVVTFYSFFSLQPKGKYVIGVCIGTACYVKGGANVLDKFSELLKIKVGQTSSDGLFTLDGLRCIGACGIAPALTINGKVYPKVKVTDVESIIKEYRDKE
jgi:NADH-quinone oxidoreductase subunit E/NADP-reducing hydrogenase subunit HndA